MLPSISIDLLAYLVCFVIIYYVRKRKNSHALPLPPGPKGYPLIGNALDVSSEATYEKYHEWCKQFGTDIIHLNMAGKSVIVLDSSEAAIDLLEKRSLIYSDRPPMPMVTDLLQADFNFAFIPYGDRWRSQRRLMHQFFHPTSAKDLHVRLLTFTHNLLRRFLERPNEDVMAHLRHMAGETIMSLTYGLDVQPENDPYIKLSEDGIHPVVAAAVPGAFLVNSFPILKYVPEWMPGAGFQKFAREGRALAHKMLELPFAVAKEHIRSGNAMPSFVSVCLLQISEDEDYARQEYLIKATAASLYSAGSDTTAAAIGTCIITLLKHPEVLRRAQEEIDSVLPFGELPTFEHESEMPFITAICMEAMRWRDVTPLSIPHFLTKDDVYKGYRLPQGSTIIPNAWAMLHDEKLYPDPFEFKPDRFLKAGKINPNVPDPAFAIFGFGRRLCPGRAMALSAVWITVASLIAAFNIANSVDENGNTIATDPDYERDAIIAKPKAFTCSIKPRSKRHEQAILAIGS